MIYTAPKLDVMGTASRLVQGHGGINPDSGVASMQLILMPSNIEQ